MTSQMKSELRPFIPLLIGQGKLAKHVSAYLSLKKLPFLHWPESRNLGSPKFKDLINQSSCAWILVSDRALSELTETVKKLNPSLPVIHSSAATDVEGAMTLHPLFTFGPSLYDLGTYETIPFVLIDEEWKKDQALKESILKNFSNPVREIPKNKRALYHAYCVMMANFPQILWNLTSKESSLKLDAPFSLFAPIVKKATENFIELGSQALTGPLVRGDQKTIERHLTALSDSKLLPIYKTFVDAFAETHGKSKETV